MQNCHSGYTRQVKGHLVQMIILKPLHETTLMWMNSLLHWIRDPLLNECCFILLNKDIHWHLYEYFRQTEGEPTNHIVVWLTEE